MKLKALALVCALALTIGRHASGQNAALMPVPKMQFFSANGVPLAGGFVYTCVAGTSCPGNPLATYTDSTAATANANPVVLDSGGFAGIWLGSSAYKIVVQDANAVTQWTVDNVQVTGLALLAGTSPLASLTVTGNTTIGGTLSVTGATSLSSLSVSGNETVGGTLGVTGASTLSGNTTIGGTLGVTGATTLSSTLGVTGATTLSSTLGVAGATTLTGGIAGANTTATGSLTATRFLSSGSTPTFTLGTGAGTGATVGGGSGGTDVAGFVLINAGTSPSPSGKVLTVTFATPYASAPQVMVQASNFTVKFFVQNNSTTGFEVYTTSDFPLVNGQPYSFYYHVFK